MPRFYFHFRHGDDLETDTIGVDCPDIDAAETEARLAVAEAMRDAALRQVDLEGDAFEIADAAGQLQLTVSFGVKVRLLRPAGVAETSTDRSNPSCATT